MPKDNELIGIVETLMDKNSDQIKKMQAEQFIELKANRDEIMDEVAKVNSTVENLQKNIDVLETKVVKNKLQGTTIRDSIHKNMDTPEYKKAVDVKLKGGQIDYSFETPILRNAIQDPDNFVPGDAPVVLPFRDIGIDKAPVRMPAVSDIIAWGTTVSNMVDWIERTGKTDGSAARAEGGVMGEGDLTYTEVSTKVKIMSEFIKVTNESLKDVSFLSGEINSELLSDLRVLTDTQLLSGDGTGNNLLGIIPQATPWAAGSFAASVTSPNNADVLRVAINQIILNGAGRWFPNYILMNPTDVTTLDLAKIADGRYIEIPYYNPDTPSVVMVPVLQNPGITEGDFLVGDFTKAKAFLRDSLTVRIYDQNEDDPIYNRSTVTANVRLAFRIKNQEKGAFITGDFATAIAALATP